MSVWLTVAGVARDVELAMVPRGGDFLRLEGTLYRCTGVVVSPDGVEVLAVEVPPLPPLEEMDAGSLFSSAD